jgi:hypothetical protein
MKIFLKRINKSIGYLWVGIRRVCEAYQYHIPGKHQHFSNFEVSMLHRPHGRGIKEAKNLEQQINKRKKKL